jgi:mRNA-degrading endonuclease RelE of RelBE toxin-antitoxin system
MRLQPTERFANEYERLPQHLQRRVDKVLGLLLENPRHPSLQIKRIRGQENRWEGRVTLHYRFIFSLEGDTYLLLRVGTHDLIQK